MEYLSASNSGLCSIEIGPDGVAFAYIPVPTNFEVAACEFYPHQFGNQFSRHQFKEILSQIVSRNRLKKSKLQYSLASNAASHGELKAMASSPR